ncbi:MAG: DUF2076 domain-containing protein [Hyphomicrobiaceae bacterium]|nr:DUF2076 domain-containing protein [Hyphomicrobiaceae bacterium]
MTPDERHMIEDLFQRLTQNGGSLDKDVQADRLINDLMRRSPDAAYMLAQTVLVYEHQMGELQNRIAELEAQSAPRGQTSGSFLGGRTSGRATSVPAAGGSPWGNQGGYQAAPEMPVSRSRIGSARNAQSDGFGGHGQPVEPEQQSRGGMFGGNRSPMPPQQPQQGGGFMRSALATAAGVAGGMMIANSLGSLFGGNEAQAAQQTADANAAQDAQQDAEFAATDAQDAEQDASFDSGGDFGGFDSFET